MMDAFVAGPIRAERGPFLELSQEAWERMIAETRNAFLGARDYAGKPTGRPRCAADARVLRRVHPTFDNSDLSIDMKAPRLSVLRPWKATDAPGTCARRCLPDG